MTRFADWQADLAPAPMQDASGRAWGAAHGRVKDSLVARARDAVCVGGVADPAGRGRECPAVDLGRVGADTAIPRLPGEASADYRTRLAAAFDVWGSACTTPGLEARIGELGTAYGFSDWQFRTARDWSPTGDLDATPDRRPDLWARWWALIFDAPWAADGTWGDAGTWDDGGTWDTTASVETVNVILSYLRQWSAARDRFYVVLYFDTTDIWGPDAPWDDGGDWDADTATPITWSLYP